MIAEKNNKKPAFPFRRDGLFIYIIQNSPISPIA